MPMQTPDDGSLGDSLASESDSRPADNEMESRSIQVVSTTVTRLSDGDYRLTADDGPAFSGLQGVELLIPQDTEDYLPGPMSKEIVINNGMLTKGRLIVRADNDEVLFIPQGQTVGNIFDNVLRWSTVRVDDESGTRRLSFWEPPRILEEEVVQDGKLHLPLPEIGASKYPPFEIRVALEIEIPGSEREIFVFERNSMNQIGIAWVVFSAALRNAIIESINYVHDSTQGEGTAPDGNPTKQESGIIDSLEESRKNRRETAIKSAKNLWTDSSIQLGMAQGNEIVIRLDPSEALGEMKENVNLIGIDIYAPLKRVNATPVLAAKSITYKAATGPRGTGHIQSVFDEVEGHASNAKWDKGHVTKLQIDEIRGNLERFRRLAGWAEAIRNAKVIDALITYEVLDAEGNTHNIEVFRYPAQ